MLLPFIGHNPTEPVYNCNNQFIFAACVAELRPDTLERTKSGNGSDSNEYQWNRQEFWWGLGA